MRTSSKNCKSTAATACPWPSFSPKTGTKSYATASERWPGLTFELCYAEPVTDLAGRIKLTAGVYAIDEMWEGREAHDQLAALGYVIAAYWETDSDAPEQDRLTGFVGPSLESLDEELPALDESLWVWDESAGTEP